MQYLNYRGHKATVIQCWDTREGAPKGLGANRKHGTDHGCIIEWEADGQLNRCWVDLEKEPLEPWK